ncbi:MAG TPA: hypothetical protein VFC63_12555 [Blastocatellia bacterium]|nr:hypothetical protein [Blastocatellia bacterium]
MAKRLLTTLTVVLTLIGCLYSQQNPKSTNNSPSNDDVLFDNDGGRVFVVRRNDVPWNKLTNHGGPVINQPSQVNIFLGKAWSKTANKSREGLFTNPLLAIDAAGKDFLSSHQITFSETEPLSQEALDFTAEGSTINDLQVQSTLNDMFDHKWLNAPDVNTIYVVFLPPGVQSTLGEMVGGKHYLAYHNFVHLFDVQVHYVVVPFEPDAKTAQHAAARAIIDTALNPAGTGWY